MRKFFFKNLSATVFLIIIFVLIVQNPLPLAKFLYKVVPIAQAEEMIRYFEEEAITQAVERVNRSVVEINIYSETANGDLSVSQLKGQASGIIVSSDGLILTNKHILSQGNKFEVIVNGLDIYSAEAKVKSQINDLALLKVNVQGLAPAIFGDSKNLKLGQTVLAIGNADGQYTKTVTRGVVSGLNRTFVADDGADDIQRLTEAIQTDAALNVGNSGGPLINIKGEVVGISTAYNNRTRDINFALPIHKARTLIDLYLTTGAYKPGWLGIYYVNVNSEVQKTYQLPFNYGAYLISDKDGRYQGVVRGSPAEKAGLLVGDIILEVNSQRIDQNNLLADFVQKFPANTIINLRIYRNATESIVNVTLGDWPADISPLKVTP